VTLAIRPAHSALLASIRQAPGSPRVVVIGAVAVGHHIPLARETGDVNLAIVAEETEVEAILTDAGWDREKSAKHRWRHGESESIVDILPASPRILRDGRLRFEGDERELDMVGFDLSAISPASSTTRSTIGTSGGGRSRSTSSTTRTRARSSPVVSSRRSLATIIARRSRSSSSEWRRRPGLP
jgi:hypothetical protein